MSVQEEKEKRIQQLKQDIDAGNIIICLDLAGKTKEELLMNIAVFAKKKGVIKDEDDIYKKFIAREKIATTGVGLGIACPEARCMSMDRHYVAIICRTKKPVDYNSIDGKPVRIIVAAIGGDLSNGSHLKTFANLVLCIKNKKFRNNFLNAKNINEILKISKKRRMLGKVIKQD